MTKFHYAFPDHIAVSEIERPEQIEQITQTGYDIQKSELHNWLSQCEKVSYVEGQKELFQDYLIHHSEGCKGNPTKTLGSLIADGILIDPERVCIYPYRECKSAAYFVPVPAQEPVTKCTCLTGEQSENCNRKCGHGQEPVKEDQEEKDKVWEERQIGLWSEVFELFEKGHSFLSLKSKFTLQRKG